MLANNFNSDETKPKNSGVYAVRMLKLFAEPDEDIYDAGYAYFNAIVCRWNKLCFDRENALKERYCGSYLTYAGQNKEWRSI